MTLDCRNLGCPEPVLKTKKALEELPNDSVLEVLVNSTASRENVIRFAKNNGFDVRDEIQGADTKLTIIKGFTCMVTTNKKEDEFLDKTLFLKDDKVGEGELGAMLIVGFLKSTLELPKLPRQIICVNRGVLLTTADANAPIIQILKEFEKKGVQIYSCGVCLEFYKVQDNLKVGKIGNAYGTVEMLFGGKGTITLW